MVKTTYEVNSILVSSNCNKNDDVFLPQEVWRSRSTPLNQPANLNHDSNTIVGHIVESYAIDDEKKKVEQFDGQPISLVTKSHIYKTIGDKANALIEQVKSGKMFVSMECLFDDYDYLLVKGGKKVLVKRNDTTRFLTSSLRAYGGRGIYEGYKVARVLRRFTFSGFGFVDTPANTHSVILPDDYANDEIDDYQQVDIEADPTVDPQFEQAIVSAVLKMRQTDG